MFQQDLCLISLQTVSLLFLNKTNDLFVGIIGERSWLKWGVIDQTDSFCEKQFWSPGLWWIRASNVSAKQDPWTNAASLF